MKKIILAALFLLNACATAPKAEQDLLDTPEQRGYKREWAALTAGKVFSGEPDLWGGGPFGIQEFAFDTGGNLHNSSRDYPGWNPTHRIVLFKSGTQALVVWYKSASSPALSGELYSLEIRGDELYRTQNIVGTAARGWTTYEAWDKKSYSLQYLDAIGTLDSSVPPPTLTVPDKNS